MTVLGRKTIYTMVSCNLSEKNFNCVKMENLNFNHCHLTPQKIANFTRDLGRSLDCCHIYNLKIDNVVLTKELTHRTSAFTFHECSPDSIPNITWLSEYSKMCPPDTDLLVVYITPWILGHESEGLPG